MFNFLLLLFPVTLWSMLYLYVLHQEATEESSISCDNKISPTLRYKDKHEHEISRISSSKYRKDTLVQFARFKDNEYQKILNYRKKERNRTFLSPHSFTSAKYFVCIIYLL